MDELIASDWSAKILAVILTVIAALGARLLHAVVANGTLRAMLGRVGDEAKAAVLEVFQVYVSAIKAASADGKLTADEKAHARGLALDALKRNLGKQGLGRLARILGLRIGGTALDAWLLGKVETAVAEAKLVGTAVGSKTSGTAPKLKPALLPPALLPPV